MKKTSTSKAQFYIVGSIFLLLFFFYNVVSSIYVDYSSDINYIINNYLEEGKYILNNAIYTNSNFTYALNDYTLNFLKYLKQKRINAGILTIINYNKIYILNNLGEIKVNGAILNKGSIGEFSYIDTLEITYQNQNYYYNIDKEKFNIQVLFEKE